MEFHQSRPSCAGVVDGRCGDAGIDPYEKAWERGGAERFCHCRYLGSSAAEKSPSCPSSLMEILTGIPEAGKALGGLGWRARSLGCIRRGL